MKRKTAYLSPSIEIYPLYLSGSCCLQGSEVSAVNKEKKVEVIRQDDLSDTDPFAIDGWD